MLLKGVNRISKREASRATLGHKKGKREGQERGIFSGKEREKGHSGHAIGKPGS